MTSRLDVHFAQLAQVTVRQPGFIAQIAAYLIAQIAAYLIADVLYCSMQQKE